MTKTLKFLAAAAILAAAVSCASTEKMVKMAENVIVTCDPAVLEAVGGNIDATVKVTYPADYFNPKAIVEVTPVLVYDGGEAKMAPFVYQGEKVKDNYKPVSSAGQTVRVWRKHISSSAVSSRATIKNLLFHPARSLTESTLLTCS